VILVVIMHLKELAISRKIHIYGNISVSSLVTTSDEGIKTNITRIEKNALDKTSLLCGDKHNDIRTEPDDSKMGLIAKEVELNVPEIVHTDDQKQ
jgi:hypothetical protein